MPGKMHHIKRSLIGNLGNSSAFLQWQYKNNILLFFYPKQILSFFLSNLIEFFSPASVIAGQKGI